MLQRSCLSLEQAQRAVNAVLAEATRDGRPMAAAVVDDHGHLICCARMDGTPERVLRFAIRKAYTAAVMGRDTLAFKKDIEDHGRSLADYGDPQFTTLQGGHVVVAQGRVVGGVAAGGNVPARDEEIASIAVQAIGV
jgi:uncharacterized protein GlcG (DUF336 family)